MSEASRKCPGRLIVLEGSDGSGKATQSRRLLARLRREGHPAERIAFPGYHRSFFGGMVGEYLRGEFGTSAAVAPRLAALLYAGDRWEAAARVREWLAAGKVVVCDRYVDSNKAHQAARMPAEARPAFLAWVDKLEFGVFRVPKPDYTIFLHVPHRFADALIAKKGRRAYLRGKARDLHEADLHHLASAEQVYLQLAAKRKSRGAMIECIRDGELLSREEIAEMVWGKVRRRL